MDATGFFTGLGTATGISLALSGLATAAVYVHTERRGRARWWGVPDGGVEPGLAAGPFRSGPPLPRFHARAPAPLRRAALLSVGVGLWTLPLIPLGFLLAFWGGIGLLLAVPVCAGMQLVSAGRGLLTRRFAAVERAVDAARLSMVIAILTLALLAAAALALPDAIALLAVPAIPSALAIAQAQNLSRTAEAHRHLLELAA